MAGQHSIASTDAPAPADGSDTPRHVAIIMDGNGRWAAARGLPRIEGHRRGVESLRRVVRAAIEQNIRYLTVYSFSSENWRRPASEVADLMGLARMFVRGDMERLHQAGVRIRVIGRREGLAADLCALIDEAETRTAANTRLTLAVAFNYGARNEILDTARELAREVAAGTLAPEAIDEAAFAQRLTTADIPDPDLVIRTSGEMRISNFLLWQAAYAEFVFTPTLWPDFDAEALAAALAEYRRRERRFGGLAAAGA